MDIQRELEKIVTKENIWIQEPMSKHTTFKIGGPADFFIKINSAIELKEVVRFVRQENIPFYIIGNGSNLLVKDNGIRGIVIKLDFKQVEIEKIQEDIMVTAEAGVMLSSLAYQLKEKGIAGFEFASGIPGTIGGANRMNAGAYGSEMKDILLETTYLDETGNIVTIPMEEQELTYRHSTFCKSNKIIIAVKLKLQKGDKKEIQEKMDVYKASRREKQPIEYPSAGSSFKRGNGFITAALIDQCGLKGYQIGDAQVSEKHAGFIINRGEATAQDVILLGNKVKEEIKKRFQKEIEWEIEIIGED